jgi:RNA polymerase sigma-70 factor, ECF subfamily
MERPPVNSQSPVEIENLVIEVQKGSSEAMNSLVEAVQNRLFRFCFYLTGKNDTAEEICQDSLVTLITKIKTLREPEKFFSWLFRVAKNRFLDLVRSHPFSKTDSLDTHGQQLPEKSQNQEIIADITRTLASFPPEERLLIILIDHEGYSYREAAEIIGISESAVTSRIHRLRDEFIKIFQGS